MHLVYGDRPKLIAAPGSSKMDVSPSAALSIDTHLGIVVKQHCVSNFTTGSPSSFDEDRRSRRIERIIVVHRSFNVPSQMHQGRKEGVVDVAT